VGKFGSTNPLCCGFFNEARLAVYFGDVVKLICNALGGLIELIRLVCWRVLGMII
jgi:hypothetical protein